jgi:diguanylate cyclase (GGDEF)-like protein
MRLNAVRRDVLFGAGLVGAFALVLGGTVWSLESADSREGLTALVIAAITLTVGGGLTRFLQRRQAASLLLLFPLLLFAAELALALSTSGIASSYTGFFALSVVYVGLTQRPVVVPIVVPVAAACWLVCQSDIDASTTIRLSVAVTMWLLVGIALATRTAVDRSRNTELLDRANTDALTGLASRSFLIDQINGALDAPSSSGSSVVVIDLDAFKGVNDMFGHAAGDELLVEIARRIRTAFRSDDTCARLGGDEFAVLMRRADLRQAADAAARLVQLITEPVTLTRGRMAVTASVGIASLDGAANAAEVLHDADLAMYESKSAGRNRASTFEREMGERRAARLQLETELRDALQHEQFELYYQPVVHLQTGAIIGTEALLRWNHPQRGLLGPAQFLSTSEEIGVIVTLGDWILHKACHQAVQWQPVDPGRALTMAVNVSAPEMLAPDFVTRVRNVLTSSGLPGTLLVLEITERLVVSDAPLVRERIDELRQLGVRIAIDDFGTGYSSLAYLRELPVDILKIDQNFVKPLGVDARAGALLKSIVAVADALQLGVIVEGVETPDQIEILTSLGCEVAQGFHFARPGPAPAITQLLALNALQLNLDHVEPSEEQV